MFMKKLFLFLIIFIMILGAGLYFASGVILARVSDKMIDYIVANVRIPNLQYTRPIFRSVRPRSLTAVTWRDVSLDATLVRDEISKMAERVSLNIGELTISLESFSERTILLSLEGLSTVTKEKGPGLGVAGAGTRIEDGFLEIVLSVKGFGAADILEGLGTLKEEIRRFSFLGVTKIPISFSATTMFEIQGKPCTAKFLVETKGEEYRLVMDKNDLTKIAAQSTGKKPNPVDIAVIARNPLKATQLMKIRDKAETAAQLAAQQNPKFPEDAYRHILWSYLLTRMYGDPFAKEVTDAHEAYADEEELQKMGRMSWESASYQDLVNNAVGRQYAAQGYPESDILERVLIDPAIIRDSEAVKRFSAVEYEKLKPAIFKPQ
jgi:hypothetical protein